MTEAFHDQDLSGRDFTGVDLTGAVFDNCTLTGASFRRAPPPDASFPGCRALPQGDDESPLDFSFANLRGARFERCDLTTGLFCGARAYDLSLEVCQLQGADFSGADFTLPIRGAEAMASFSMTGCNFSFGDLSNTCLNECVMTGNRMIDVLAHNCSLSGADLSGSELSGLSGSGLDIARADLRGASFNTLDPREVNMAGVRMGLSQGLAILDRLEIVIDPEAD